LAHRLLVDGGPEPLLRFGATPGKGIAFGLALLGVNADSALSDERIVRFDEFELVIGAARPGGRRSARGSRGPARRRRPVGKDERAKGRRRHDGFAEPTVRCWSSGPVGVFC